MRIPHACGVDAEDLNLLVRFEKSYLTLCLRQALHPCGGIATAVSTNI